jgi:Cu(I)/Ag(I) efflux system membrane protein CusA/SilA
LVRFKWEGFAFGCFDANGEGEVVGGIVVMRYGENADKVIQGQGKNERSSKGLPRSDFKTSYDRSDLIEKRLNLLKVP